MQTSAFATAATAIAAATLVLSPFTALLTAVQRGGQRRLDPWRGHHGRARPGRAR